MISARTSVGCWAFVASSLASYQHLLFTSCRTRLHWCIIFWFWCSLANTQAGGRLDPPQYCVSEAPLSGNWVHTTGYGLPSQIKANINYLQLYVALQTIRRWSPNWANCNVCLSATYNFCLSSSHILGPENVFADRLSRLTRSSKCNAPTVFSGDWLSNYFLSRRPPRFSRRRLRLSTLQRLCFPDSILPHAPLASAPHLGQQRLPLLCFSWAHSTSCSISRPHLSHISACDWLCEASNVFSPRRFNASSRSHRPYFWLYVV